MEAWLHCKIYPGQFSSEFAVIVESFSGKVFSLFATRGDVRFDEAPSEDQPSDATVRVRIVKEEEGNILVWLPQCTLENGQMISVKRSQLEFVTNRPPLCTTL